MKQLCIWVRGTRSNCDRLVRVDGGGLVGGDCLVRVDGGGLVGGDCLVRVDEGGLVGGDCLVRVDGVGLVGGDCLVRVDGGGPVGGDCLVRVDGLFGNEGFSLGWSWYIGRCTIVVIWMLNAWIYVSRSHLGGTKRRHSDVCAQYCTQHKSTYMYVHYNNYPP